MREYKSDVSIGPTWSLSSARGNAARSVSDAPRVTTTRWLLRILFAAAASFVFWRVQNPNTSLIIFFVYFVGLFVDEFTTSAVRRRPKAKASGRAEFVYGGSSSYKSYDFSDGDQQSGRFADFFSTLVAFMALCVMADSFFFTTWFQVPSTSSTSGVALLPIVKIIASLLCILVVFVGPLVPPLFFWQAMSEWLENKRYNPQPSIIPGLFAGFPTVLVVGLCYCHFLVGHAFYSAIGLSAS